MAAFRLLHVAALASACSLVMCGGDDEGGASPDGGGVSLDGGGGGGGGGTDASPGDGAASDADGGARAATFSFLRTFPGGVSTGSYHPEPPVVALPKGG